MKLSRTEKIWLAAVIVFYILYNLPFFPGSNNPEGTIIHGAVTLIPLWISVYLGLYKVVKGYKKTEPDAKEQQEEKKC